MFILSNCRGRRPLYDSYKEIRFGSFFFFFLSSLSKIRKQRSEIPFQNCHNIIVEGALNGPEGSYPLNCSRLIV